MMGKVIMTPRWVERVWAMDSVKMKQRKKVSLGLQLVCVA